jgi:Tol biopolymer transport system component
VEGSAPATASAAPGPPPGRRRGLRVAVAAGATIAGLAAAVIVAGLTGSRQTTAGASTTTTPRPAQPLVVMIEVAGEPPQRSLVTVDPAVGTATALPLSDETTLPTESVSWSPDGRMLAMTRSLRPDGPDRATDVWIARADGTAARRLTTGEDGAVAVWTPDGTAVALTHVRPSTGVPVGSSPFTAAIWLVPIEGGDETRLTDPPTDAVDEAGSFSPDGTQLAFTRCQTGRPSGGPSNAGPAPMRCDVYRIRRDGTGEALVVRRAAEVDWAPDGAFIVTSDRAESGTVVSGEGVEIGYTSDIYRVAADGSAVTRLTDTPTLSELGPRVSPGGGLLAYAAAPTHGRRLRQVMVMNADGTCPVPVVRRGDAASIWQSAPSWRPGSAGAETAVLCPTPP